MWNRSQRYPVLVVLASGALAACDDPITACTDIAMPAIVVIAVDSASGAALGGGTTLVLQDGSFIDSVTYPPDVQGSGIVTNNAHERAGVYEVRVRRAGYALWERANVRVTSDRCHVRTVVLEARLQTLP